MSSNVVIDVAGLGKAYRIFRTPPDRLRQVLWRGRKTFYQEFWALHPLSFQLRKGECIGFLGKNGSGKSTLLQMLAGTLEPSVGMYTVSGRLSALLELGAGFNPEFTGRENVLLSGALLGMAPEQIEERIPAILKFAELGDFIDRPVKTYSSGMYVRLAFSTAIHVDPELLLVDEALSVGDAAFQYKCLRRIEELRSDGMSILFVTHDTGAVRKICDRAGWIDNGHLVRLSEATAVADEYDSFMRERASVPAEPARLPHQSVVQPSLSARGGGDGSAAEIRSVRLFDKNGHETSVFPHGEELGLELDFEVLFETTGIVVGAAIFRNDDLYVSGLNTGLDHFNLPTEPGRYRILLSFPRLCLLGGEYYFKVGVFDKLGMVRWDFIENAAQFKVTGGYVGEGLMAPEHSWVLRSATAGDKFPVSRRSA